MMIEVVADAEGEFPELQGALHGVVHKIGALHGGMKSGEASVAIAARLDDGRMVMLELSMRHFMYAATMFEANYTPEEMGRKL